MGVSFLWRFMGVSSGGLQLEVWGQWVDCFDESAVKT